MYMMIGVLKRRSGMDRAAFRKWWIEEHAEQARKLPGLRKYLIYPASHGFEMTTGEFNDRPAHDGVAFLYFDDEAACRRAFASTIGVTDREHMEESPVSAIVFCSGEEIDIPPATTASPR